MARDFESLIVDPSLVDPSIDTSNLRTTTDTREELLSDVPEFQGIQFDPTQTSYLDDLYALYSGQLPMTPVTPAATTPTVGSPTSGGGGGGGSGGVGTTTTTTPITTDITSDDIDEVALTGGQTDVGGITGDPITIENISSNPYNIPMSPSDPGASIENLIAGNLSETIGGAPNVFDVNQTGDPSLNPASTMAGEPTSGFLASGAAGGANLPSISDVKVQGGLSPTEAETLAGYTPSTSITPADTEQTITEKIAGFLNVDTNKLNKAAVTSALNLVAGKALDTVIPIASVFNLVKDVFVTSPEEKAAEDAAARQNIDEAAAITQRLEEETTPQDIIDDRGRGQIPTKDTKPTVVDRPTMADIAGPSDDRDDGPGPGPSGPTGDYEGAGVGGPAGQGSPQSTGPADRPGGADAGKADFGNENVGGSPTGISGPPGRGGTATTGPSGPPSQGGGGGGDGCFLAGTLVTMADGLTKPVEQVDLKDNVAEGGKVFATGKFLIENLYDYKGIKVSGSHMVHEDDNWVRVKDSKQGQPLGDDEHTVYVFGSENRRILINGILFTDYFEVKEQEKFLEDEKKFFKNWKQFSNEHNESNVNILNAS